MRLFLAVIKRDIRCRLQSGGGLVAVFSLPFILFILFPLVGGAAPDAFAVQWLALLLALLGSLGYLFGEDAADGSLDALLLAPLAMEWVVAAKCLAHWLVFAAPLVLAGLALGSVGGAEISPLIILGFLFGSTGLVLIGAVAAALVVGIGGGGALVSLLALPLYIPILIFAATATEASLVLLVAIDLILAVPCLWLAATALRHGR